MNDYIYNVLELNKYKYVVIISFKVKQNGTTGLKGSAVIALFHKIVLTKLVGRLR